MIPKRYPPLPSYSTTRFGSSPGVVLPEGSANAALLSMISVFEARSADDRSSLETACRVFMQFYESNM